MRSFRLLAAAALVVAAGSAFAQGPAPADEGAAADPAKQKEIDTTYRDRCEKGAPKELCSCVIAVADSQLADPAERQVFYDFMMGDVEKAKTARGMFSPQKNSRFNQSLQKADVMLGEQCDKLKPQQPAQPTDGQKAPQAPGQQKL